MRITLTPHAVEPEQPPTNIKNTITALATNGHWSKLLMQKPVPVCCETTVKTPCVIASLAVGRVVTPVVVTSG